VEINERTDMSPGNHSFFCRIERRKMLPVLLASILVLIAAVIGFWDIYCVASSQPENTVSALLRDFGRDNLAFVFFAGFLAGHLFWQRPGN
jgi:hypothetical protein